MSGRKRRKGFLRTAFAAAVGSVAVTATALFGSGVGAVNNTPDQFDLSWSRVPAGVGSVQPEAISAFGQVAPRLERSQDPLWQQWSAVFSQQRKNMQDPAKAQAYDLFLAQFEYLRGEPLARQADEVNKIVNDLTAYWPDLDQYKKEEYWASPIETVLNHKGDCEDFAILEEAVLRYLGVPENRLFFTLVNTQGSAMDGTNHAILLVNEAPDGAPQEFFIMGDAQPVLPADNEVIGKVWVMSIGPERGWRADFVLMDARNGEGYWRSPENPDTRVASAGTPSAFIKRGPRLS